MDRVIVYVDYQNVYNWARRMFVDNPKDAKPVEGHIRPEKLGELLVGRRQRPGALEQVRVYRGRPNPAREPKATRANDRQTDSWQRHDRVKVIRRDLKYRDRAASEKGIDVAIGVDMIRLAMEDRMDVAVLFSSDNDLLPAVEVLWNLPNTTIELATWAGAPRLQLPDTDSSCAHSLSIRDYEQLHDPVDHAARQA